MDRWLSLLALVVMGCAISTSAPIPWQDADGYIGEDRTVEGRVVSAHREGNVLRLSFDENANSFSVGIIAGLLSSLPADPNATFVGRTIRATGRIRSFRGVSEMMVRDLSQIVIVPDEPKPIPTAREAGLEERLRQLEIRLDRLERRLAK